MDVLKPYLLLACAAFMAGFVGYLGLVRGLAPPAPAEADWQASISAPAVPAPGDAGDAPLARGKLI